MYECVSEVNGARVMYRTIYVEIWTYIHRVLFSWGQRVGGYIWRCTICSSLE